MSKEIEENELNNTLQKEKMLKGNNYLHLEIIINDEETYCVVEGVKTTMTEMAKLCLILEDIKNYYEKENPQIKRIKKQIELKREKIIKI